MIQVHKLWATPLFTGMITRETNDAVRDHLLAMQAEERADPNGNHGDLVNNWTSKDDLQTRAEFAQLCEEIKTFVNESLDWLTVAREDIIINCMWANIAPLGCVHLEHIHANAQYSGVVYLNVPVGAVGTFFRDPRPAAQTFAPDYHSPSNEIIGKDLIIEPEDCKITLWPAWLAHGVPHSLPNPNVRRIVLSYNIMLRSLSTKHTARLDTRHL
jgi:uncharacterized protein (TIGR02466 family)